MYICVGCMLAFSTLKFSLDIPISWMGQSIYSPYSPYSPYMITVIVGVSRSGVYVDVWGEGGSGDRCINALTRMQ